MGEHIDELKKYEYLGYVAKVNGNQEEHVRESGKKSECVRAGMGSREKEIWK